MLKMTRISIVSLVLFEWCLLKVQCDLLPPIIRQTQNGPVEGIEQLSELNQRYYSFEGVPYAQPPINELRFKAPKLLQRNWTVPLKVHERRNACTPSDDEKDLSSTSEDCLFLNIYVPAGGIKQKTVFVFIHGGGFRRGSADFSIYGPDHIMAQDNILVNVNYRLGIFGFLNLGYGEYTGNMGLKDQQMALKWIYENIEQFSGKKNEILLFGESAGGQAVQFHMLNAESRKYFNRAFSSSGSALNFMVLRKENHIEQIRECSHTNDINQMIEYLKTTSNLILGKCCVVGHHSDGERYSLWIPTIESASTDRAFLTRTPEEIYNLDLAPAIDVMFGFNSHESVQFRSDLLERIEPVIDVDFRKNNISRLPFNGFSQYDNPKEYKWAIAKLLEAYFPDKTNVDAIKGGNIALLSDIFVGQNVLKAITLQANANSKSIDRRQHKNTFFFRFSVATDVNFIRRKLGASYGSAHMDDLCYMFHCRTLNKLKMYMHLNQKDMVYDLIMRSVKMITNFARTGDPSIEGDTPFKSCRSSNEIYCQEVSNELKTHVMYDIKKQLHYDLWHTIEMIAASLNTTSTDSKANRFDQGTISITFCVCVFAFIRYYFSRI